MPTLDTAFYDVIIAGAGPVGLFLAGELRLAGVSVLMLEQAEHPNTALKSLPFGLRGLSVPTIESLDRRDLLDEIQERSPRRETPANAHWMQQKCAPGGHFAGIPFFCDQIDTAQWPYRLPGAVGSMAADMASIEAVLARRATRLGATIRRSCGFETFEESDAGVIVRAGGEMFAGRWLVGCDGGRSAVRKAAGVAFTGTNPEFTGYSAQVVLADPSVLTPGRHYTPAGMYNYAAPGTIAMVDFDGGVSHRIIPSRDHIEAVLRKVSSADVSIISLEIATTWTDRAYQATMYRRNRVLLAGDAAHVHSPLGGQGLNLGLGDAMNLGWKLAATIRGDAPDALLDTYASERQPVGAQILDWSRAQVALMRPSASSRALEAIVRDVIATGDGATYFAERVWGVGLRYDLGESHPLAGRSAPDFEFADGSRVNEHLRAGRGLLLDFSAGSVLQWLPGEWVDRIAYVSTTPHERMGIQAALIRPDGIIAWACEEAPSCAEVQEVMRRWFGAPENSA
ncbi:FAD-dependent monooxygenase [Sphingomonas abietis]|uniref:FAD-dependent monooxygenase n=1 Tax=Sphingomonas abietis TaxID=3012344 RepID=A0ABY7NGM1_9SPHN|nr:FAD-dependent monooxygenase [Sphingomonas abietis]WBO20694.1 FAD-dependent monooxygenase [Sphingomonas abietis]